MCASTERVFSRGKSGKTDVNGFIRRGIIQSLHQIAVQSSTLLSFSTFFYSTVFDSNGRFYQLMDSFSYPSLSVVLKLNIIKIKF